MGRKEQYIFHKGSGHRGGCINLGGRDTETRSGRPRNGTMRCSMVRDGDWEFGRWQNLNIVSFRILLVDVHDDNDGVDGWSNEKRR